jgi:hypothetical protein
MERHATETAGIDEAEFASGAQLKDAVGMRRHRNSSVRDQQPSGHAKVDQPLRPIFGLPWQWSQVEDDVFADTAYLLDAAAGERLRHFGGRGLEGFGLFAEPGA